MSRDAAPARPKPVLFDEDAIARAEAKLRDLSVEFDVWMAEEIDKLHHARLAAREAGWSDAALDALFAAAHDAKGLGATYDYPLVTEIAGSLCRMIETPEARLIARRRLPLIDAHVESMRAAVRDRVKTCDHPIGQALLRELRRHVEALGLGA